MASARTETVTPSAASGVVDSGPAAAPVRSMTGYAVVRKQSSAGELTVSLRSVNHRGLDLHFHLGSDLAPFENALRAMLKRQLGRGHVEIRLALTREGEEGVAYNGALLRRYIHLFRQASADFDLAGPADLNTFFSLPGVLQNTAAPKPLGSEFEPEVVEALRLCIADLNAFRRREGEELGQSVTAELAAIESGTAQMAAIRAGAQTHFLRRLETRLTEILGDAAISPARLVEEAALLADRSDVQEELTRLAVHSAEVRRLLEAGGEVGKRLDFLLQEMNRETNTILSKTSGIGEAGLTITGLALSIKANIERMREQALNLE